MTAPAAPLEKAVAEARKARTEYDRHRALEDLLAALDADPWHTARLEAEAALEEIADLDCDGGCGCAQTIARRYFAEKGER